MTAVVAPGALPGAPAGGRSARWMAYGLAGGGVAILLVFAATTNLREVLRAVGDVRPAVFGIGLAAVLAQMAVKAARWRYMIHRVAGVRVSGRFAVVSVVCGVAAGAMTPGRSFELAKAVMLRDAYGVGLGVSLAAMVVERLLDIIVLIVGLLIAAMLLPRHTPYGSAVLPVMIALIVGGAGVLATAPHHVRRWAAVAFRLVPVASIRERATGFVDLLCRSVLVWRERRTLGALGALTGLVILLDFARVAAVFWALRAVLSLPVLVFTYVGAMILGMALLVPGGVGVTEVSQAGLIGLLAPHAVSTAIARSGVLVDRIVSYYAVLVVGGLLLMAYHRYHRIIR